MSIELQFEDRGPRERTPIVLVHGFPLDSRIWKHVADIVAATRRVITLDLPGFGQSPLRSALTMDLLADQIKNFLDQIDASPCHLAGLSMGGYVAGAFAERHPAALKRLLLVNTKTVADTDEAKVKRDQMASVAREQGATAVADRMMPNMLAPANQRNAALVTELRAIMESQPAETIAQACIAMRDRSDYTAAIAAAEVPTLVIAGESDVIIPIQTSRSLIRSIPNAQLNVIPGAGHMGPLENPADVARAIASFCSRD